MDFFLIDLWGPGGPLDHINDVADDEKENVKADQKKSTGAS